MPTNVDLARIFSEMAEVLELTGADPFRVNAHARVARVLKDLTTDVASLADDASRLTAIEGIGPASAKKIIEYVRTGQVAEHRKLLAQIPPGLLDVLAIPGLGPKTVRLLWEQAGVEDLDSLKARLDSGELEELPRMGAKTIQNIRESVAFAETAGQRILLGRALPIAEAVVGRLRRVPGVTQARYAGSVRRGRETIGDIDILAAAEDPDALSSAFRGMDGVAKVLLAGDTKVSVRLDLGVQVDLRMVEETAFGAALMYFTGSKEHNVALRERALKRKLRLNEYGLFPDDGSGEPPQKRGLEPVAAVTEEEIYRALDLPWIPAELREDRGEFTADLPRLIEAEDVKADLHAHTVASDGRITIEQLAVAARGRGFHTIAVTDHSKSSAQAGGLSPDDLRRHIEAIREADTRIEGISVLAGSEVDILASGQLDYEDDLLAELDVVVASPHSALRQEPDKATQRLLTAVRHPLVHVVGHPTGRLIGRREGLAPDIDALVEAAAENDTALEINANYLRLDLRDTHVRAAVEAGALLSINCDAHDLDQLELLPFGVLTARRGWLTAERCINTWSQERLHGWLKNKRVGSAVRTT